MRRQTHAPLCCVRFQRCALKRRDDAGYREALAGVPVPKLYKCHTAVHSLSVWFHGCKHEQLFLAVNAKERRREPLVSSMQSVGELRTQRSAPS